MKHVPAWQCASLAAISLASLLTMETPAPAAVPEAYQAAWKAAAPQIDANIERCRKGDATISVVGPDGLPLKDASLTIRQQTHEFLFGCNLFVLGQLATPELNRKYEEGFARLFNFATIPFYWRELEPQDGKLRFVEGSEPMWRRPPPDQLVKWCKAHGITAKGHALMYAKTKFMPDWIDPKDGAKLKTLGARHMGEIAQRYGNDFAVWDVVNEEIPRLAKPEQWHQVPDDYLAWCFEEAGRLFPKQAKLLINDGTSQSHVTTDLYETMIKGLLDRRVRVEGIGIQFHIYNRNAMLAGKLYPPDQMSAVYERLGRFGLPLYITEITVAGTGDEGPTLQGEVVANLYRLWFSTPAMAGITWWNLGDGTAFGTENKAMGGLMDEQMNPKPAYQALDRLINHDWRTNLSAKTDGQGKAQFRGFYGKYTVEVKSGSQVRQFEIDLSKDRQHQFNFSFKTSETTAGSPLR
jgi:GH35 family endo-1,4-beta-xylanase